MRPEAMTPTQRRVAVLMELLRRGAATTRDLADALRLPVRTVRDDLNHLEPVAPFRRVAEGRHRHWQVDDGFAVEGLGMLDRISLTLGRELTSFLSGTALGEVARPVRPWEGVPTRLQRNIGKKVRLLLEPARDYSAHRDTIDLVLDALLRERQLSFTYQRKGRAEQVAKAEPLTLVVYRRALYLVAQLEGGVRRRFSIDQVSSPSVDGPFAYPRHYQPDEDLTPWFGIHSAQQTDRVRIRFTKRAARYVVRRTWHPSQTIEALPGGGVVLEMTTGGRELVRFVLEWGGQAEVLAPPWLRDAVVSELRDAVGVYAELQGNP